MIKYYFFVEVKKKEVDVGDYNGFTFEFELVEPKSLVKSRLKEIARVILVLKSEGAGIGVHCVYRPTSRALRRDMRALIYEAFNLPSSSSSSAGGGCPSDGGGSGTDDGSSAASITSIPSGARAGSSHSVFPLFSNLPVGPAARRQIKCKNE